MAITKLADRSVLRIAGSEVFSFLQGLVTADVRFLERGEALAIPAAFLSPKGKVLADCILHRPGTEEAVFLDVNRDVAGNLLRLLKRHRLRLALEMDIDESKAIAASPTNDEALALDPRFVGLGYRGVVDAGRPASDDVAWYTRRRVMHGVPEGPPDFGVDSTFPLHGNLDLLGAVSFSKGCYVGQELTTRSKMRGAVRKRFITLVASSEPPAAVEGGQLSEEVLDAHPDLVSAAGEEVVMHAGDKVSAVGALHTVSGCAGLCSLKLPVAANSAKAFVEAVAALPPLFLGDRQLHPVLPPYSRAVE